MAISDEGDDHCYLVVDGLVWDGRWVVGGFAPEVDVRFRIQTASLRATTQWNMRGGFCLAD